MKKLLLGMTVAALCYGAVAAERNLFSVPGFETWSTQHNLPDSVTWRWGFSERGANGFTAFERSGEQKHSGNWSLHIKDAVRGNYNHSVWYQIAGNEIMPYRGKVLRCAVWVKQMSASEPNSVGITLSARGKSGAKSDSASIDVTGETQWKCLQVKIRVPEDADGGQLHINCAAGWGRTAEAYFDDVILAGELPDEIKAASREPAAAVTAVPEKKEVESPEQTQGVFFPLFGPPKGFYYQLHGGFAFKHRPTDASDYAEIYAPAKTIAYSAFLVRTDALTGTYDLGREKPENLVMECVLNLDTVLQLRFADMPNEVFFQKGEKLPDGRYLYRAGLKALGGEAMLRAVRGASIQFPCPMPAGTVIRIFKFQINADKYIGSPRLSDPGDVKKMIASYTDPAVVTEDSFQRPSIDRGTWVLNGKYHFFQGPWIYPRHDDWGPHANPLKIQHIAYNEPPGKAVFDAVGFNSAQISGAHPMPGQVRHGLPVPVTYLQTEKKIADYYKLFQGMPLVLDFAFGYNFALKQYEPEKYKRLDQKCGGWHEFIPFCPEDPEGDRYYRDYFIAGAASALKNGGNIFVYELFNESVYNCQCRYNIAAFAKEMQRAFGTIEKANAVWRTVFDDFD
ncbi:MAG: hypothetical protein PHS41_11020, partial [Victivallaceae bacterium]|nr:hypothetical protein [Victivallaceae bacterium]